MRFVSAFGRLPDKALRIVVRNGFGRDLADNFLSDLRRVMDYFESLKGPLQSDPGNTESFSH